MLWPITDWPADWWAGCRYVSVHLDICGGSQPRWSSGPGQAARPDFTLPLPMSPQHISSAFLPFITTPWQANSSEQERGANPISYISETVIDLLLHRTNEIRLKLLWGFTGNWPCQSFAATKCCTTSRKFNVNLACICSFTLPYFHNANVSISDFDCPLTEKLPAAPAWCREWCEKNCFESIISEHQR